jgi:hypothetical protein
VKKKGLGPWLRGDLIAFASFIATCLAVPGMPRFLPWGADVPADSSQGSSSAHTSKSRDATSGQVNFGCGETLTVETPPIMFAVRAENLRPQLTWANTSNAKTANQKVAEIKNGNDQLIGLKGLGSITGLDTQFLNCPGGGHAELVLHASWSEAEAAQKSPQLLLPILLAASISGLLFVWRWKVRQVSTKNAPERNDAADESVVGLRPPLPADSPYPSEPLTALRTEFVVMSPEPQSDLQRYFKRLRELRTRFAERKSFLQDELGKAHTWIGYVYEVTENDYYLTIHVSEDARDTDFGMANSPKSFADRVWGLQHGDVIRLDGTLGDDIGGSPTLLVRSLEVVSMAHTRMRT